MRGLRQGMSVRVEKRRRTGVVVDCADTKDGQVCVRLNGRRGAHRHYRAETVEIKGDA